MNQVVDGKFKLGRKIGCGSFGELFLGPDYMASWFEVTAVLLDAYMMDFVFSEREDGGSFYNKNGIDYHIPVLGGDVKEPPMHIVHIAVEMAPIAKFVPFSSLPSSELFRIEQPK
ncbi:starch synthase 3 [Perilla frutescens var. hirtella]|uniref:starch synthase n=1 Tax=Perilla frutescens var. hirtella TaxID=608512 RepID=A0AAD4JBD2_PERFH|nr:starch synthase 3 [Perilla frutescens var. hirtella]